ncbi:hypothetical protein, partial [Klebsiella pneumoniae]|uniref:hypothetical protein n=1 Tax=Klebsiella pneumoniae TaxID=573 RepID=UPI0025A26D11
QGHKAIVFEKIYNNKVFYVEEVFEEGVLSTRQMIKTGLESRPSFLKKCKKINSSSDIDVPEFNQINEHIS